MKQSLQIMMIMLLSLIAWDAHSMCSTTCNISAHTTLVPRKMSQNSVLELALDNYYEYHRPVCGDCPSWFSIEVTAPYYFKSTRAKRLAGYFLPNCQQCITIGENNTSTISSPWLSLFNGIATPYQSTLCMKPHRSVIGGAVRLFFDLSSFVENCGCWDQNWWLSIFIPFEQVRHNLDLTETPSANPGTFNGITNAIQAFNNPAWLYGKWSPTTLKKFGVDDICIKLGCDMFNNGCDHAGLYGLLFVPTGRGTKAKYLFEPLVGGNHVGAGVGVNADYAMYACDNYSLDFMLDARYAYFFKHKEVRSIDLFNGDLSRYLLVVLPNTMAMPMNTVMPLPGINYFTQKVEITPRSMFEIWAAVSFNRCNFHFEFGYDFWYCSKEKIQLPDVDLGVGIFDIAQRPATTGVCNITASCARICQAIPGTGAPVSDTTFTTVKNSKAINKEGTQLDGTSCCPVYCSQSNQCSYLNLDSAANPKALTSTVYAAASYDCCLCCEYPVLIGVGGQYEFAHRRSALSQYGVWLKTAISF